MMYRHWERPEQERQRLEKALLIFRRLDPQSYVERSEQALNELGFSH